MIKAIFFDFDGVLTIDKTGSESIIKFLSANTKIPYKIIAKYYYQYNKDLLLGNITHKDIWNEFCDKIEKGIDFNILTTSFENTLLDEKMINLLKSLKSKYIIGMITDNKSDRINTIIDYNKLNDYFDIIAISADLHSLKKDKAIFNYVLIQTKLSAEQCIFIDNTAENLIIPNNMGMKTILFEDNIRDFNKFKKLLDDYLI